MNRKLLGMAGFAGVAMLSGMLAWQANQAQAQSGSRSTIPSQAPASGTSQGSGAQQRIVQQPVQAPFEVRFWDWLAKAQYRNWGPIPGRPGDAYTGENPHGAMVKLYANRTAAANPEQLPHGSVLIKENYGPDGTTLMAITAMYRSQGFNPEGGDWFWVKYEPNGQVSRMEGMAVAGKVGMCIECHGSAGGNDFSFANDR